MEMQCHLFIALIWQQHQPSPERQPPALPGCRDKPRYVGLKPVGAGVEEARGLQGFEDGHVTGFFAGVVLPHLGMA